MADEARRAHLAMVQQVVSRIADNSFKLKGWAVVLVSGLFGLSAADANRAFALVAYVPVIGFWMLDAYYLHQERLFRGLYDQVRITEDESIDYSMDTAALEQRAGSPLAVAFSPTLLWLYAPLLLTVVVVSIVAG